MKQTAAKRSKKSSFSLSGSRLALPLSIAAFVGSLTAIVIVGFVLLSDRMEELLSVSAVQGLSFLGVLALPAILAAAGLLIGILTFAAGTDTDDQGVAGVLKAIALKSGRIPVLSVVTQAVTAILALGAGFSVGREGPAVHIGAGIGSRIARLFRYSEMRVKNLAACGAAAGISAVFNAPITGVMFALEIILRDFGARALSTVVVSSVAASIVSRIFLGESPAFTMPIYRLRNPMEIFIYVILGILSAFTAYLLIASLDSIDRFVSRLSRARWMLPGVAGLVVGSIGIFCPQILGMGFHVIEEMLAGKFPAGMLLIFLFLKIAATSVSLGGRSSGGALGPTLFMGAALGGALGELCQGKMPFDMAPSGAYALVGMASVFAGAFHAPVTAILLVFEMTGDYKLILPLMVTAVLAVSLAQILRRESVDTIKFARQGISLEHLEGAAFLGAMQVKDAMSGDFLTVPRETPAKDLLKMMSKAEDKVFFAVNHGGEVTGILRPKNIQVALLEQALPLFIADDVAEPVPDICFPEEVLGEAASIMKNHNVRVLPVMNPDRPKEILGVLKSEDVFRAYTEIAFKREELVSRMEQEGSHSSEAVHIRFVVSPASPLAGKKIKELTLPDGVVLTSVQRKKETVIPEGNTLLGVKDKVWAVVLIKDEKPFRSWLKENKLR